MKLRIGFLILGLCSLIVPGAKAQVEGGAPIAYLYCQTGSTWSPCSAGNPLAISGSLSIAGSTSNATSGVATSSTNLPTVSYTYGFNGTTWDQLQVDGSKNLKVNVVTGGGGGVADQTAWTNSSSTMVPAGGVYNDSATALTSGNEGTVRLNANREMHVTVDAASSNALWTILNTLNTTASSPIPTQSPTVPIGGTSICDGANGTTNPCTTAATVKAASTLPAATDKSLVVGLNPGSATAGSPSGAILSIQGVSGGTSVPVTPLSTTAAGVTQSDPCTFGAKTNLPITSNTSALTQIIAASGSTKVYICSLAIISASAEWITFNTGTGTNCGSSTAGLIGGTTVGTNGLSLAANGGLTLGNGGGTIALTGAGGEVCVALSSTTYVTGNLTYVQQ